MRIYTIFLLLLSVMLASCSNGDNAAASPAVPFEARFGADHFLQFANRQNSLAAGNYTLVAATRNAAAAGAYELIVQFDDGRRESITGSWASSGGESATASGNPRLPLILDKSGGITVTLTSSDADPVLFLLDSAGREIANDDDGAGHRNAGINLLTSNTDNSVYAQAYYRAIDPNNLRTTLTDWQQANGFDEGSDVHLVFRDTNDLGYGRNMFMRRKPDGSFAAYVENYQVAAVPGQQYSRLNLDAAVATEQRWHVGTNAIEWGPVDSDGDGSPDDQNGDQQVTTADYFPTFYTFLPIAPFTRLNAVDLDGNGPKDLPTPCAVCHGGRADPLLPDGKFPRSGDINAHMQALNLDTFEYADGPGLSRAEQEADFKFFNRAIYDSYLPSEEPESGDWDSSPVLELLEFWYGGRGLPSARFTGGYLPAGWQPDATTGSPPAGADDLYHDVIAQNCRSCHLLQGTINQDDANFSTYGKFISYPQELQDLVFDKGRMPLSLLPFADLHSRSGALAQLAAAIPGFDRISTTGALLLPGRPIAKAGRDRRVPAPATVYGSASLFAVAWSWQIVEQPANAMAVLLNPDRANPVLQTDLDGEYVLELTVFGEDGDRAVDSTAIHIDSTAADPPTLSFINDIQPVLNNEAGCADCHTPSRTDLETPVFYTEPQASDPDGGNRDLYTDVRARVNFADPENSRLLSKPGGNHHNGGLIVGFDLNGNHDTYDLFYEWILAGAPERAL